MIILSTINEILRVCSSINYITIIKCSSFYCVLIRNLKCKISYFIIILYCYIVCLIC
uniref:Unkown protein n=1 Tax=Riptortus pedestris TaxID=329032 RepID=R4WKF4_RIPPE|nr:unkown protein [Riptortus pedestris]